MINMIVVIYCLLLASLLTIWESVYLGSCHSSNGPSVYGFWGLCQVIADGINLLVKSMYNNLSLNSSSVWLGIFSGIAFIYVIVYLCYLLLFIEFVEGCILIWSCFIMQLLQAYSHYTLVLLGQLNNNSYMSFACYRVFMVVASIDYVGLLLFLLMLPDVCSSYNWNLSCSFGSLSMLNDVNWIDNFLFIIMMFFVIIIESNSIPFDLFESESELIAGISIEFNGLIFGLFASIEYATILFNVILLSIVFIEYSFGSILVIVSLLCLLSATLPSLSYYDCLKNVIYGLLPFALLLLCLSYCF